MWDTIVSQALDNPHNGVLYYAAARLWAGMVGDSVASLRAFSALLSLLLFPLIFWLCWELFGSTTVAWTATLLLADAAQAYAIAHDAAFTARTFEAIYRDVIGGR